VRILETLMPRCLYGLKSSISIKHSLGVLQPMEDVKAVE
jgi:hypothetical protein